MSKRIWLILILMFGFSPWGFAKLYKYAELNMLDYEEMEKDVFKFAKRVQKAQGSKIEESDDQQAVEILEDSLRYILSRPSKDRDTEKLVQIIRPDLIKLKCLESAFEGLTTEALTGISNKNLKVDYRATYVFMLENILSEVRPDYKNKKDYAVRIVDKIKNAKIKLADDVANEIKVRIMAPAVSPSIYAEKIAKEDKR